MQRAAPVTTTNLPDNCRSAGLLELITIEFTRWRYSNKFLSNRAHSSTQNTIFVRYFVGISTKYEASLKRSLRILIHQKRWNVLNTYHPILLLSTKKVDRLPISDL